LGKHHHLLDRVHPLLAKKHPDYEAINRVIKGAR